MSRTLARATDVSLGSPLTATLLLSATAEAQGQSYVATIPLEGLPADNRPDQLFFVWQILGAEFHGDARCRVSLLANDAGAAPGPTDDPRGLVRTTVSLRLEFEADCPAFTNTPLTLTAAAVCSDGPLDSDAVTWPTVTPTESALSFTTAGGSPVAVGAAVLVVAAGGLTTEQVEDAVAAMLVAGDGVALDYDDEAGTLEISATGGSGGSGATLKIPVTQAGHGFSDYQAVYPTPDGYGLALALQADADDRRADAAGVIIVTSDDTFDLYRAGKIEGGPFTGAGETWFLSDTAPGLIALDAPTADGSVWKPLVQVQPDGTALVGIEAGHVISTARYARAEIRTLVMAGDTDAGVDDVNAKLLVLEAGEGLEVGAVLTLPDVEYFFPIHNLTGFDITIARDGSMDTDTLPTEPPEARTRDYLNRV